MSIYYFDFLKKILHSANTFLLFRGDSLYIHHHECLVQRLTYEKFKNWLQYCTDMMRCYNHIFIFSAIMTYYIYPFLHRCHRNDLENITPFLIIGLLYIFTGPSAFAATWHYRLFVGSRFIHTIAYLLPLPQPSRALGFFVGVGVTVSMAVQVLQLAQF